VYKNSADQQWDFTIYYWADKTAQAGLNPYQVENLKNVSGLPLWLTYVYPPMTLWVFRPFSIMAYGEAYFVWLGLKLAVLAGLIVLWRRYFLRQIWSLLFLFVLVFGFDSALFWDLRSGNIALFETALLYLSFVAILKGRFRLFALMIVLISLFKVTTLFFLLLLLFFPVRRRWRLILSAAGLFALVMTANYLFEPGMYSAYLSRAWSVDERARDFNYSLIAFLQDLTEIVSAGRWPEFLSRLPLVLAIASGLAILAAGGASLRRIWRKGVSESPLHTIFLACFTYALIFPRLKCYTLVLLIVPMFYLMRTVTVGHVVPALTLLLCLPVKSPLPEA
jgi:hypothetical protein